MKRRIFALLIGIAMLITALCGCKSPTKKPQTGNSDDSKHLTVYLWDSSLIGTFTDYVKAQCPELELEFISGNNNVFLYDYLKKTVNYRIS